MHKNAFQHSLFKRGNRFATRVHRLHLTIFCRQNTTVALTKKTKLLSNAHITKKKSDRRPNMKEEEKCQAAQHQCHAQKAFDPIC
jgi:hypothetical protein